MKQILFVASEFPPNSGGVGVYVRNLARWLSLRGWDCWVATWGERSNLDSEHRVIRIPFRRVPEFGDILFSKELDERRVQLGLHDAIVNVHSPYPQSRVKPDVSTFHAVMRHVIPRAEFTAGKRAVHMFALPFVSGNERRLMRAPVVLAVSESVVDQLRKSHGFQGHASIVGNGVDPTVFRPGPKSPTPVVLYVGRLDLNKGVMDLVQIARLVLRALPDVKFRIVGVGEARRMLTRAIRRFRLEENICLLGRVTESQLVAEYQQAWVFLSPSRFEGLATTTLEAMASGTVCVLSDVPGHSELVTSKHGYLVQARDIGGFADSLLAALGNPEEVEPKIERALAIVKNHFTWDLVAIRYDRALSEIMTL